MKPVAIDLFCGLGGWTDALIAKGFSVYGFDINPQPLYKGIFVQADILTLTVEDLRGYNPVFATCSSPCEQFSVHGMKHFHPNPPYPEMGIWLFNHSRALLEQLGVPYVMENVRPAKNFVGRETNHCGPFYLWGTGVPAVFPPEAYKVSKGVDMAGGRIFAESTIEERRMQRKKSAMLSTSSGSKERKALTAAAAMIPPSIANAVAELACNIAEAA